jgi:hypothetical protein
MTCSSLVRSRSKGIDFLENAVEKRHSANKAKLFSAEEKRMQKEFKSYFEDVREEISAKESIAYLAGFEDALKRCSTVNIDKGKYFGMNTHLNDAIGLENLRLSNPEYKNITLGDYIKVIREDM